MEQTGEILLWFWIFKMFKVTFNKVHKSQKMPIRETVFQWYSSVLNLKTVLRYIPGFAADKIVIVYWILSSLLAAIICVIQYQSAKLRPGLRWNQAKVSPCSTSAICLCSNCFSPSALMSILLDYGLRGCFFVLMIFYFIYKQNQRSAWSSFQEVMNFKASVITYFVNFVISSALPELVGLSSALPELVGKPKTINVFHHW